MFSAKWDLRTLPAYSGIVQISKYDQFNILTLSRFYKVHPACHSIKPGSNSKKTDKHDADCSKVVRWGVK